MPLKIVLSFTEQDQGWSETYYNLASDPAGYLIMNNAGVIQIGCPAYQLIILRAEMLNQNSAVTHIRASVVATPRTTLATFIPATLGTGEFPAVGQNRGSTAPAETFSKLLLRLLSATVRVKSLWIGGIPEQIISPAKAYAPTSRWNTALGNFSNLMRGGGYVNLGRPTASTPPAAVNITSFVTAANGQSVTVTPTTAPAGPAQQWYTIVRGVKFPRGWNGVHRSTPDPTNPLNMILGPTRKTEVTLPAWVAGSGGTVQLLAFPTAAITSVNPQYITQRKVGRPFDLPRGRRP